MSPRGSPNVTTPRDTSMRSAFRNGSTSQSGCGRYRESLWCSRIVVSISGAHGALAGRGEMRARQFHRRLDVVERAGGPYAEIVERRRDRDLLTVAHRRSATTRDTDSSRDRRDFCSPRNRRPSAAACAFSTSSSVGDFPSARELRSALGKRLSIQARMSAMTCFLADVVEQIVVVPFVELQRLILGAGVVVELLAAARFRRLVDGAVHDEHRQL